MQEEWCERPHRLGGAHVGDEAPLLVLGLAVPPAVRDEDLLAARVLQVDLAPGPLHSLEGHGVLAVDLITRGPLVSDFVNSGLFTSPHTLGGCAPQAATGRGSPTCSLSRTLGTVS